MYPARPRDPRGRVQCPGCMPLPGIGGFGRGSVRRAGRAPRGRTSAASATSRRMRLLAGASAADRRSRRILILGPATSPTSEPFFRRRSVVLMPESEISPQETAILIDYGRRKYAEDRWPLAPEPRSVREAIEKLRGKPELPPGTRQAVRGKHGLAEEAPVTTRGASRYPRRALAGDNAKAWL